VVAPADSTETGWAVAALRLLDQASVVPDEDVVAAFRVHGETLGGEHVSSQWFRFPVRICRGCLIDFSASYDDPELPGTQCVPKAGADVPDTPCRIGQNDHIACVLCSAPECQSTS
jgi:hypothetical protein